MLAVGSRSGMGFSMLVILAVNSKPLSRQAWAAALSWDRNGGHSFSSRLSSTVTSVAAFGKFLAGDFQQLGQIYFLGLLADQMTIEHQFGGIPLLLIPASSLRSMERSHQDGINRRPASGSSAGGPG